MKRRSWIPVAAVAVIGAIFTWSHHLPPRSAVGSEPERPQDEGPPPGPSVPAAPPVRPRPPVHLPQPARPAIALEVAPSPPPDSNDAGALLPPSREGIRAAVHASRDALRECYAPWLELQPQLHGRIGVSFLIEPGDGGVARISDVQVQLATTGNRALEGCVRNVFAELRFGSPAEPIRYVYPLVFVPEEGDGG